MEIVKNTFVGAAVISTIVLAVYALMEISIFFGGGREVGQYIFFTIIGLFTAYNFGGLTRTIFFNKQKS